jgi:hypothetical protein
MPSVLRHPYLLRYALWHPLIFALGFREAHSSNGMTYDENPWSARSMAYDAGRDLRCWGRA